MSEQNLSETSIGEATAETARDTKAAAGPADLFARKGNAKPAGRLIAYERKPATVAKAGTATAAQAGTATAAQAGTATAAQAGTAKDESDDQAETAVQEPTPETVGDAASLLNVIEFRKAVPGGADEPRPESKARPEGKSISELSEAVSEALAEPAKPPKPNMAPFSKSAPKSLRSAPSAKMRRETEPRGKDAKPDAKPKTPSSSAKPKAPPAATPQAAGDTASPKTAPLSPPASPRPPRQESGSGLPFGLLAMVGLMLAGWFAVTNLSKEPDDNVTTPAASPESAAPAAEPAAPPAAPEAESSEALSGAAGKTAVEAPEPSFDLIRIEPDGEAVIAGRAAPNAELILLDNGEPIGRVTADWAGQWAFIPEGPLPQGDHQFSLVVAEPQGTVTLPAPEATKEVPAGVQDGETPPAAPEDGAAAPEAGIGEQSYLAAPEAAPEADPAPLPGHKPDLQAATGEGGEVKAGYFVQLSSVVSLDGAQHEREKLQRIFPELLGDMELAVEQAKLGDSGTRYRVRAGLFAEMAPARALCQKLRLRSQDCLVIKQ